MHVVVVILGRGLMRSRFCPRGHHSRGGLERTSFRDSTRRGYPCGLSPCMLNRFACGLLLVNVGMAVKLAIDVFIDSNCFFRGSPTGGALICITY